MSPTMNGTLRNMAVRAQSLLMLLILFPAALCGSAPPEKADATWERFVETAKVLEYSDAKPPEADQRARKTLEIKYPIWGPVLVADGDRTKIGLKMPPKPWGNIDSQILLASGDITGDGKPEYVLAAGWWGPLEGRLIVYDENLHVIGRLQTDCIWQIELRDLTGDGCLEILCREEEHRGTGVWGQWLSIVKYREGKGLVAVWKGTTYAQGGDFIEKHRIDIQQEKGKSATIVATRYLDQYPWWEGEKKVIHKDETPETKAYIWDDTAFREKKGVTWRRFVEMARPLYFTDSAQADAYEAACKALNLRFGIDGPVVAAEGDRTAAKGDGDGILLLSGDVTGDGRPEYILGAGWTGPWGGVLVIYDEHLQEKSRLDMASISQIELRDLTNDGDLELVCHESRHPGSGMWSDAMVIVKYFEGRGLEKIWEGTTYNHAGHFIQEHRVEIKQGKREPATIVAARVFDQYPGQGSDGKLAIFKDKTLETRTYAWDGKTFRETPTRTEDKSPPE